MQCGGPLTPLPEPLSVCRTGQGWSELWPAAAVLVFFLVPATYHKGFLWSRAQHGTTVPW